MLQVGVVPASVQEREGAYSLLRPQTGVQLLWADAGYWGEKFETWVNQKLGWKVEIITRNELVNRRQGRAGYIPLPRRWVVERSFAWLSNWRRLSCDYEQNTKSSQAWITIAFLGLMLNRIQKYF